MLGHTGSVEPSWPRRIQLLLSFRLKHSLHGKKQRFRSWKVKTKGHHAAVSAALSVVWLPRDIQDHLDESEKQPALPHSMLHATSS